MSSYDDDLELVCDRCDVKISEKEKAYAYKFETICEECEDNNGYIFGIYHYDGEDIYWEIDAQWYKSEEERDKAYD